MKTVLRLHMNASSSNTPTLVQDVVGKLCQDYDSRWGASVAESGNKWVLSCPDIPIVFEITPSTNEDIGTVCDNLCDNTHPYECDAAGLCDWIGDKLVCLGKIISAYDNLNASRKHLNAELSSESASRIKDVFKAAQQAVEFPKGFRYTAFRQNRSEDCILSTLEFASTKLGAKQWVVKSALSAAFTDELEAGSTTGTTVSQDEWAFQPEYDPDGRGNDRGNDIRSSDRLYTFTPRLNTTLDPDKQATYWLVGILQNMVDDILDNPPNRVYEFFLAEGLLHKKNIAKMSDMGLIRLIKKGVVTGIEVLKAKPALWKKLLEKEFITGEQAYKAQPGQLFWLTVHDYIPVERALKIDPQLKERLSRAGKLTEDSSQISSTDVDTLVNAVAEGTLTAHKAWSLNNKVIKPLVEKGLITPQDAYKLEPSVLNWMLENHYVGREEATRLKPGIKKEMNKKGVDWESLDASRKFYLGDAVRFRPPGGKLSDEIAVIEKVNSDGTFRLRWEDGDVSDGIFDYSLVLDEFDYDDASDEYDDYEELNSNNHLNASNAEEFYVSAFGGELVLRIYRDLGNNKWREDCLVNKGHNYQPSSYMGYLNKEDILSYIRSDFQTAVSEISQADAEAYLEDTSDDDQWETIDEAHYLAGKNSIVEVFLSNPYGSKSWNGWVDDGDYHQFEYPAELTLNEVIEKLNHEFNDTYKEVSKSIYDAIYSETHKS